MEYPKNETQEANVGFLICQLDRKKPAAPSGDDPHILPSPLRMDSDSFNSVDTLMKILFDSEEAGDDVETIKFLNRLQEPVATENDDPLVPPLQMKSRMSIAMVRATH